MNTANKKALSKWLDRFFHKDNNPWYILVERRSGKNAQKVVDVVGKWTFGITETVSTRRIIGIVSEIAESFENDARVLGRETVFAVQVLDRLGDLPLGCRLLRGNALKSSSRASKD